MGSFPLIDSFRVQNHFPSWVPLGTGIISSHRLSWLLGSFPLIGFLGVHDCFPRDYAMLQVLYQKSPHHGLPRRLLTRGQFLCLMHPHSQGVYSVLCPLPHWLSCHTFQASITDLSKPLCRLTWPNYRNIQIIMMFISQSSLIFRSGSLSAFFIFLAHSISRTFL